MAEFDDPKCASCSHVKSVHYNDWDLGERRKLGNGRCHGSIKNGKPVNHSGDGGYPCTCPAYREPVSASFAQQQRSRFTRTRGDTEIGNGTYSTSNLQGRNLADMGRPRSTGDARSEVPEWVMVGVRMPDGSVEVYASTKLSFVSLRQEAAGEFEKINADLIDGGTISGKPWDLRGRMVGYISTRAGNYADALKMILTKGWKPGAEQPEPPEPPRPPEPTTADLQRQAALADLASEPIVERATEYEDDDYDINDIIDAEIVDDD